MAVLVPGKFLYLATPHTGSRSVAQALCDQIKEAVSLGEHHSTLDQVADKLQGERLVTGVRNPYDLFASWWTRTYAASKWPSFHDFVRDWDDPLYIKNGQIFYHWKPGVQILRFEELQKDFDTLLARYKLESIELPHINKTEGRAAWMKFYDAESYALVNKRVRAEIVAFGYEIRS